MVKKAEKDQLPKRLGEKLEAFRNAPAPRDPEAHQQGRANFLAMAEAARGEFSAANAARKQPILPVKNRFAWKGRSLASAIGSLLVILTVLFGGAGAAYAGALQSLPGDPLYGLKVWSENARLELSGVDRNQFDLSLQFADRRMTETAEMLGSGEMPPEEVMSRYAAQVEHALRLSAGMEGDEMNQALLQIQERLQQHEQLMLQLNLPDGAPEEAVREQVKEMVQHQLQLVGEGISEPQQWRQQLLQADRPDFETEIPGQGVPGGSEGYGPGPEETEAPHEGEEPQNSFGPGPQPTEEPTGQTGPGPHQTEEGGSSYGPGGEPDPGGEDGHSGEDDKK